MSFQDFTPRSNQQQQQGLKFEDENGNGVYHPHRRRQQQQQKQQQPLPTNSLRRSSSTTRPNYNNVTSSNSNGMTTTTQQQPLHYCRSKSDSTHQAINHHNHHNYPSSYYANNDNFNQQHNQQHSQQQQQHSQQQQSLLVQQREEEYALQVMQQRETELRDINRQMHAVNEIYKDLGEVVEQQQDQIDEVEDKFAGAADATRRGLEQIDKAKVKSERKGWRNRGKSDEEEKGGGVRVDKRKQFLLFHLLSKSASEVAKMVSVCGGSGSASYVAGESWTKK